MEGQTSVQLTFEVGGKSPDTALIRLSGSAFVHRELQKGEEVHLQIVDADGVVVANSYGAVVQVAFRDRRDEQGTITATERVHTVKVT